MRSLEILTSSLPLKFMKILCEMQNEKSNFESNELPVGNKSGNLKGQIFKKMWNTGL